MKLSDLLFYIEDTFNSYNIYNLHNFSLKELNVTIYLNKFDFDVIWDEYYKKNIFKFIPNISKFIIGDFVVNHLGKKILIYKDNHMFDLDKDFACFFFKEQSFLKHDDMDFFIFRSNEIRIYTEQERIIKNIIE